MKNSEPNFEKNELIKVNWEDIVKENSARKNSMRMEDANEFTKKVMKFITDELNMRYEKLREYKPLGSDETPFSDRYVKFYGFQYRQLQEDIRDLYFGVEFIDGKGFAE